MDSQKELVSGWTLEGGEIYHFDHLSLDIAERLTTKKQALMVVESVNWTLADENTCHYNRYFAIGFGSAIALAAKLEILSKEVAEEPVGIRPANSEEEKLYWKIYDHYASKPPEAISDEEARSLPDDA